MREWVEAVVALHVIWCDLGVSSGLSAFLSTALQLPHLQPKNISSFKSARAQLCRRSAPGTSKRQSNLDLDRPWLCSVAGGNSFTWGFFWSWKQLWEVRPSWRLWQCRTGEYKWTRRRFQHDHAVILAYLLI